MTYPLAIYRLQIGHCERPQDAWQTPYHLG